MRSSASSSDAHVRMWLAANDGLSALARGIISSEVVLSPCRPIAAAILAIMGGGCFAPFPHDRHDLVDFRIVGVQVSDAAPEPGQPIEAKALVYGGNGFYHDALPTLAWSLGALTAEGPVVVLDAPSEAGSWDLELVVTHADGHLEERAVLPLEVGVGLGPITPPSLPSIQRGRVVLPLGSEPAAFSLDARAQLSTEPADGPLGSDEAARLRLPLDDPDERYRARWMTAGARGTFMELDALVADWVPAAVVLDEEDGEIEVGDALGAGLYGIAVLVIDDEGSNAWAFADINLGVPHGDDAEGWAEHHGRLLDDPDAPRSGLVELELVQDDGSPWGVVFAAIEPYRPWVPGTSLAFVHPPCEHPLPQREPFRMDWIAEGLCSRQAVLGQRVVMRVIHPIHTWSAP
jgi:hypothetical protein